jgi:hypothetical protein
MVHLNIPEIPEKYFIDRWRKKAEKVHLIKEPEIIGHNPDLMFNILSKKLVRTTSTASKNKLKKVPVPPATNRQVRKGSE